MLLGEYHVQISDKYRVAIPKKLRARMGDGLIITKGYEQCLILIDSNQWMTLINSISKKSLLALDVRDSKRYLLGGAMEIEPDSQGRFVLSENHRSFAYLEESVVFVGIGEWVEIWDRERWSQKTKELSNNVSDIADRLSEL